MTGPARAHRAARPAEADAASDTAPLTQLPSPTGPRRSRRWFAGIGGARGIDWVACGVAAGLAMIWVVAYSGWRVGSKADWFFGASVFSAVVVALWLALTIQRQALGNAADAVDQLRRELAAVAARSAEELAHARELHRLQGEFHRAEVEAHRELARVQRAQLLAQQQRQATIDVSRAIGAHTHTLAMLWDQGANIVRIEDPQEREQALQPIFERISQVVNDFAVELANAHVLVEDDRLHAALNRVNDAVLMAIRVAEDVHAAFIDGRTPEPNPIPPVQLLLRERAAEARHLAWELLSAGLGKA